MPRIKALEQRYREFDVSSMIRGYQKRANKTQADMAEYLGITQQAYSHKLKRLDFSLKDIQRIYKPLMLSKDEVYWLVTGREET